MRSSEDTVAEIDRIFAGVARHPTLFAADVGILESILESLDGMRWFIIDDRTRERLESYAAFKELHGYRSLNFVGTRTYPASIGSESSAPLKADMDAFVAFWKEYLEWRDAQHRASRL